MGAEGRNELQAPEGLRAETFEDGGQVFAILEIPLAPSAARPALAPAEAEVLALMLRGLSNAEIAQRRSRSPRTVAHQVESIFRRLGVGSRLEVFALVSSGRERP